MFLVVKAFEWTHEIQAGFTITSNLFWSFYYTAAGLHALHVIAGMIIMLIVAPTATQNESCSASRTSASTGTSSTSSGSSCFPLLYIAK